MIPPIITDNRGDVSVYDSVAEAESSLEPVDVRHGEYIVYDSEGQLLVPEVESKGRRERVVLKSAKASPAHANDLERTLRQFLAKTKFGKPGMERMGLGELLGLMPRTR